MAARTSYKCFVISIAIGFSVAIAADRSAGQPQFGTWGYDTAGGDTTVKPGDNFFAFANGTWLKNTPIPPDKRGVSLRSMMSDRTEARLREMMERAAANAPHQPSDLLGKIGAFYRAFMNESRVQQLGVAAIEPELRTVRAANNRERLAALMGRNQSDFEGTLFNFGIDVDLNDPAHYAFYVGQGGLGLPDRDYYLVDSFAMQKAKYRAYVVQLLAAMKWPAAEVRAKEVVDLETRIAEASWTKTQQRDPVAIDNHLTVAELEKLAPGLAWTEFFRACSIPRPRRLIVAEKSAFPKLARIFAETPVPTLQAWQAFQIADNAAPYLSHAFADAWFDLHEKTLAGQQEQRARWKRAITAVSGGDFLMGARFGSFGTFGFGVGEIYLAQYFGPEAKAKIEALVANLKAAYRVRLEHLDWMSPETKVQALKKLDTYAIKVAGPVHRRDYSKVIIADDDLAGDVRRAGAADWAFYSARLSGPVDRTDWSMTPQTNDAYNGTLRDIVFPAGILQPPIFDENADPAVNYGAVGGVIGHELTHGFDDQGRRIDAAGALRDWWTKGDAQKFEARARSLRLQYSAFEPVPGAHINGALTLGENIADLGGLTLALDAWRASLKGQPATVIDGMTGEQRVFLGWAQAWRGKSREDAIRQELVSDPHSPRAFRVNGVVRNLDAWYGAFAVKPGDKLYLAPEARVRIW